METNEKFYTDQEFEQSGIVYAFTLYATQRDSDRHQDAQQVMIWQNNDLTRHSAQLVLMGIIAGARCKYKHPRAILYATDPTQPHCQLIETTE